jgi:hypothetical protein
MRRLGVLAAGALALCALPGAFSGQLYGDAQAAERQPVSATLIMSRGHEVLTLVIKNNGSAYACIDPTYTATARISAFTREGKAIRNVNAVEGQAKAPCTTLAPGKSIHVVYDLRPLYPVGLPGYSRICYGSWWKMGGVQSLAPSVKLAHCLVLPQRGIGRR